MLYDMASVEAATVPQEQQAFPLAVQTKGGKVKSLTIGNSAATSSTPISDATFDNQTSGRPRLSRQRRRGACNNCRSRRIRCDAISLGVPCTNCTAFSVKCSGSTRQMAKKEEQETSALELNSGPLVQDRISNLHPMQLLEHHLMLVADDVNLYVQFMKPEVRHAPIKEPGRVAYVGESTNFPLLVNDDPSSADVVHYQLPENFKDSRAKLAKMEKTDINMLRQRGALSLPPWRLCDDLVESYFKWVAPILPIINRGQFMRQYKDPNNPPSLLLLQAVFLAGSMASRNENAIPGDTFYKRAKALYDTGYEDDRIITVQALILIGWYLEKSEYDFGKVFYWNGLATTIAQGSGIHRSAERSTLAMTDKRLWRRIWWTLFARDRSAALLGQLLQIHTDDSDLEMVCEDDFIDEDYPPDPIHVQFFLQYVRLCTVISVVLPLQSSTSLNARSQSGIASARFKIALVDWLKSCPKELRWGESSYNFWSASLHRSYNATISLLHRADLQELCIGDDSWPRQPLEGPHHLLE